MELVGCAASVSQLLVYLSSSAISLQRLYTEFVHCNSIYRDEATNIRLLLYTLQRLGRQHVDDDDHSPVLPVLISISGIACQVLHLLKPKRIFVIDWAPVTSKDKIILAFETLDKKRNLLHLYISQEHQEALVDLRQRVESSCEKLCVETPVTGSDRRGASHSAKDTTGASMDPHPNQSAHQPTRTLTFTMTDVKIAGHNSMFNGRMQDSVNAEIRNYTLDAPGKNFVGNENNEAERILLQPSRHSRGHPHPDYAHMTARAVVPLSSQGNHAGEATPRFSEASSNRFVSPQELSPYRADDSRAERWGPSWHGNHHAQPLEGNFTSPQYCTQQLQGPERSLNSPHCSNRQVQGQERDFHSPRMNESRLRHPNYDQAEDWYQEGNRQPPANN